MKHIIYGRYEGSKEEIDEADSGKEVQYLISEYKLAFGAGWDIWSEIKSEEEEDD